jgi:hypothetical protein
MNGKDAVKELNNLPTTVYHGFYQLRITHSLRDEIVKLLEKQIPLVPHTDGSTILWNGNIYCRDCGWSIVRESNYCPHCGRAINWICD